MKSKKYRETENQRGGDIDVTDCTEEVPPLATRVATLQEAVQFSHQDWNAERSPFIFARALKALEITTGLKLKPDDLNSAFTLWWALARSKLPPQSDVDE